MVDVGSKRCDHPDGCSKRTHFGQPGSPATRCATHKEPGMVSINGKHCNHPGGCSKEPSFGHPGGPRTRCATHKQPDMVCLISRSRARGSPSGVPDTAQDAEHRPVRPAMLATAASSKHCGGTGEGGMGGANTGEGGCQRLRR